MSECRVVINLTDEQFDTLQRLAKKRAQTPEASLKDTIEFYLKLREALTDAGWKPPAEEEGES